MTATPSPFTPQDRTRMVLLASIVVTALLWVVPGGGVVGYPLLLLSTYVHELGHGLTALLIGGSFLELEVFANGSGVALTRSGGGAVSRALVAAGGLVGPAVAAGVGFVVGRSPTGARRMLVAVSALAVLSVLLWVRSLAGVLVALGLAAVCGVTALVVRRDPWPQLLLLFLSVQLALSVFSRGEYLFTSFASTGVGGLQSDSEAIATALVGPYWFWGGVCGLVSVAVLAAGVWSFLRGSRSADA